MNVIVTHVEAGGPTSIRVETDQGIPIWITVEDAWDHNDGNDGEAIVEVVGQGGALGEVRIPKQAERRPR